MPDQLKGAKSRITKHDKTQEAQIQNLALRVERMFSLYLDDVVDALRAGEKDALNMAQALLGIEEGLKRGGLTNEIGRLETIFGDELEFAREEFKRLSGAKFALTVTDFHNVQALVNDQMDRASRTVSQYMGDIRSIVLNATITGDVPDLKPIRQKFGDSITSNIETDIRTSLQGFSRAITLQQADESGLKLFLYIGPDDDVTRPFCQDKVDQIFTKDEIDGWDNGQGLPANIYLGGYNCRHQLRPITEELAKELGWEP